MPCAGTPTAGVRLFYFMGMQTKICTRCKQEKELHIYTVKGKQRQSCVYCSECFKIKKLDNNRKYVERNRIELLKRQRERRFKNIELYKAREARYRLKIQSNPETKKRISDQARIWRNKNKERKKQVAKKWYVKNIDKIKERAKIKRQTPDYKKFMKSYLKSYYERNMLHIKENAKRRRLLHLNINKEREKGKKDRQELKNYYVASTFLHDTDIVKPKDIPGQVLEMYKLNLILKRLKREKLLC